MGKYIKQFSLILVIILLALLVWKCPIETMIGIPCPGCMMTTAFYYLIQFDFESAYYFNPVIYLLVIMFVPLVYSYFKNKSLFKILLWITLILWGVIYVYRIITIFPNYPMIYVEDNMISKVRDIYESIISKW